MIGIRKKIIAERQKLNVASQDKSSQKIKQRLITLDIFKQSKNIAIYLPIHGEVNTIPIIKTIWAENKHCYLPIVIDKNNLLFALYKKGDSLNANKYKILEPILSPKKLISVENLNLVVVPLVGFDENRNRLGYGAGYYDRTFAFKIAKHEPFLIGIAYELQKTPIIPNPWDVPLDLIITEKKIYTIPS